MFRLTPKMQNKLRDMADELAPPKKSKYRNVRVVVDGRKFDSRAEARRYGVLRLMEKAGEIFDLKCQVPFKLHVNGFLICTYIADFVYGEPGMMLRTVEDVKGVKTDAYVLKKKLMLAVLGITIKEVTKGKPRARKP